MTKFTGVNINARGGSFTCAALAATLDRGEQVPVGAGPSADGISDANSSKKELQDMVPERSAQQTPMAASDASMAGGEIRDDRGCNGHTVPPSRAPFARFRRSIERFRIDGDEPATGGPFDDDRELEQELMLLREENVRLKVGRHRVSDIGTLIDQLRLVAVGEGEADAADEAWSILTECIVMREGLEQACAEIETAIGAVRRRLHDLGASFDAGGLDGRANGVRGREQSVRSQSGFSRRSGPLAAVESASWGDAARRP
jgi:hypothetical protein